MNKYKNRILQDPDPVLWQQAEEEESRLQKKINERCSARVEHLSKRLIELKNKLGENVEKEKEYYELRDELVIFCQTGFLGLGLSNKDCVWVRKGLNCLLKLYDSLITGISKNFVISRQNRLDLDDVKSYAQQLFCRLVTGDTPWTIKVFMNQTQPSHETKAALSEIQVHKIKRSVQLSLNQTIEKLERFDLHPDDIKLAKFLFQEDMKNFSEWTKQSIHTFPDWVKSIINREVKLRQEKLSLGLVKDKKRVDKFQQDIQKLIRVLSDNNLLQALIKKNHLFLEEKYEEYKKSCYRDEKYIFYDKGNFTVFIQKYLPLRLIDLYRRKELIKRIQIPLEEAVDMEEKPDLINDILASETLEKLLSLLTPTEKKVFKLHLKGRRNIEIAKECKVTNGRISQILKSVRQKAPKAGLSPN